MTDPHEADIVIIRAVHIIAESKFTDAGYRIFYKFDQNLKTQPTQLMLNLLSNP